MNFPLWVATAACCWFAQASMAADGRECFDEMPGELGIPYDTPNKIRMTPLTINERGAKAFVATEYLGSGNLQASVYLLQGQKYCLAGDLGAATDVRSSARIKKQGYFGLIVESKSGPDKFYRSFTYKAGEYVMESCRVKAAGSRTRACQDSEK